MPQSDETQGGPGHASSTIHCTAASWSLVPNISRQQSERSALSKEGIRLINSCGAVKPRFNLNVLNTPWHFNQS